MQFAQFAKAQKSEWDPGLPKDVFGTGTPPGRLRPAKCKECDDKMAALQAALDDWYAMRLAEIDKILGDSNKPLQKAQESLEKERGELLKGLGDPKDGGAAAKKQQKKNSDKDFEEVKKKEGKGKKSKDILKEKIARALKDLQDCEANCPPPEEPKPVQPETPAEKPVVPGGGPGQVNPPPPNIQIPKIPDCFKTQEQKDEFLGELDKLKTKATDRLNFDRKQANPDMAQIAQDRANIEAIDTAIQSANKVPVCPTPAPKPPGGGGKTTGPGKGKPKKPPGRIRTGNISLPIETFCTLISDNKIKVDITGTGETIGHIGDARISNLTDEPISLTIPPAVLESRSEKNQNYGCPRSVDVALKPHESKTVPLDGVCLDRKKPPVGKGIGDDLAFNDCDPDARIEQRDSDRMLRITESVYEAADKLEEEGKLKEIPYKDPDKRKEIVEQWATWIRMSEVTGDPPPTKDDLKKVVEKQVGKVPPDKQKKIDQGIDTIFEKIELTTDKAKDLDKVEEPSEGSTTEERPPVGGPEYIGQTQIGRTRAKKPTPTPTPQKGGGKTTDKPAPTPTPQPKGPGTEEKPKDGGAGGTTEKPGGGKAPPAAAKPKEAVVVTLCLGDKTNEDMLRSANALVAHINNAGKEDAERVVMSNDPKWPGQIQSLDELQGYLKNKVGKGACLHSVHMFAHGYKNDSTGNYVFNFPPRANHDEDGLFVQDEDPREARPDEKPIKHGEFGKEKFAKIFQTALCPDGEGFLEMCWSAKGGPDSLAQYVADHSGRKMHGHTETVLYPLDMVPKSGVNDQNYTADPKTEKKEK